MIVFISGWVFGPLKLELRRTLTIRDGWGQRSALSSYVTA
jgi:hypothetical protein